MTNELQIAINFTVDDLQANRQGNLSLRQRQQLENRQQRSRSILMGIGGVVSLLTLGAVLLGNFGIIVLGVMALIIGIMGTVEYFIGYQTYTRDLEFNDVEAIQGVLHYVWRGESALGIETTPSGIRVGDRQFLLLEDQARTFIEGEIYVIYYAPSTNTLLSAEWVQLQQQSPADTDIAYWESSLNNQQSTRQS